MQDAFELYLQRLVALQALLAHYGVRSWPDILIEWIEHGRMARSANEIVGHAVRTRAAFGGMSSLNDVFISREAGHRLSSEPRAQEIANSRLTEARRDLYNDAVAIISQYS
jgi:hypothetical protein